MKISRNSKLFRYAYWPELHGFGELPVRSSVCDLCVRAVVMPMFPVLLLGLFLFFIMMCPFFGLFYVTEKIAERLDLLKDNKCPTVEIED